MSSLKKILDAIDVIHSDCFMIVDHHGPGYVGYMQAIARRQDDGTWLLERKAEQQRYSVATGQDLKPPEVVGDFDTLLRKMAAFNDMYHEFGTVEANSSGTHFETVKMLMQSGTAERLQAIRTLRRNRGPKFS